MPPASVSATNKPLPALLFTALVMAALFALYFNTASSIVALWNSSETFAHGYVILPISLWLIWRRRANFLVYPPRPFWPALLALALAGAAWLVARMGEVQVVMQYAFATMLPLAALAMFGLALARSLAFPLLFVLFAVPFGEVFIDPLISFTADFTVWCLHVIGMPVLRNGTHFEIPSGSWSVVEACSGVRYLISSITLGCLYGYLTYRTWGRRLLFVGLSIVVPVIANGLRAFMIVMIGHYSGMTLAVGVDHLIYGWLFFGLVMLLMFWIGGYWHQDQPDPVAAPAVAGQPAVQQASAKSHATLAGAVIALAALWPAWAAWSDGANHNPHAPGLALDLPLPPAAPFTRWEPRYTPPDASLARLLQADGGPVAVHMLFYRNQRNDKALITSSNGLTGEKDPYHTVDAERRNEQIAGRQFAVREAHISGPDGDLLVWHWLRVGSHATANNYEGKLWQAWRKLSVQGDDGAAIMVATPLQPKNAEAARTVLRNFLQGQLPAIDAAYDSASRK
ncbi:exosortase A [Duganella sp. FT92W]|uniref:Exosortase A n=2 Tax=Pseudoduganella rivuli TaxID=2666085 RepID=A0A7X2IUM6_9BURK|nr:exosortase A [Pseudoduganella rivuli]